MRLVYLLMLFSLSACSANKNITKCNSHYMDQDKCEFKALSMEFKVFQKAKLTNANSSPEELDAYVKRTKEDTLNLMMRASKLKRNFEEVLSSDRDLENVLSLAYISMIYYHVYHELNKLNPPFLFDDETRLLFSTEMHKIINPLLVRSKRAQLSFRKLCIRTRFVSQCSEFRRSHASEMPKSTLQLIGEYNLQSLRYLKEKRSKVASSDVPAAEALIASNLAPESVSSTPSTINLSDVVSLPKGAEFIQNLLNKFRR